MTATTAIVGLGSNLGSREALLVEAVRLLDAEDDVSVEARSLAFCTAPIGPPQPDFLNAAVRVITALPPRVLLERLLDVERRLGRVRTVRWGARTVDLDFLWWSGGAVDAPELRVPHPRLTERAFALAPLLDVAPTLSTIYGVDLAEAGGAPPSRPWTEPWPIPGGLSVDAADDADALALASRAWSGGDGALDPVEAADALGFVRAGGRVILGWEPAVIRGLGGGGRRAGSVTVTGAKCVILASSRA